LEDVEEREVGGLRIRIDRLLCVGFGDCMEPAPALFEFDEEGIARFVGEIDGAPRDHVLQACRACPVDAITVFDSAGDQLIP
jgi:ferredoxin